MINLKLVFGNDTVGKMLIMKKAWELRKKLNLSQSEALKQSYVFYNRYQPKRKKLKFDLSNFLSSNNQIEYVEQCNKNTLTEFAWYQIVTSGSMSNKFIDKYLDKILSNAECINQKLQKKPLFNIINRNTKLGESVAYRQFATFAFEEDFIREVLAKMQEQNANVRHVLIGIYLGISRLSKEFYIDYQEFMLTDNEEEMICILEDRGKEIPYEFLHNQQKYVHIDKDNLEHYFNYSKKHSDWIYEKYGVTVKQSARRTVFVLNEMDRKTA